MEQPWIVDRDCSPEAISAVLAEHGFAIIPNAMERTAHSRLCAELDEHFETSEYCEGLFYGKDTRRFGGVLAKSRAAQDLALHPLAHDVAKEVLGPFCEDIQLNLTQAIELSPGSLSQAPHRDQDIWLGAVSPGEMMLNAMWALDDFTVENGATMVWPGTHRKPEMVIPDTDGVPAVMPAGSLCLFLGSTIHNGGANFSSRVRRGLVISYCLGWLKPAENPWLSYPPEVARDFAPGLARLVGYRQDAPSLNNVDGRCPSELLRHNNDRKVLPFIDRLTPEQEAMIEQFNAMQLQMRNVAA
ncbi:MAG: phytanoyl-CoA dioxygenase family protein [Novosphingobium sp.]|nr:phytanoyl-CoA dioxygenase family protein [Novosphingobium sp.]